MPDELGDFFPSFGHYWLVFFKVVDGINCAAGKNMWVEFKTKRMPQSKVFLYNSAL